MFQVELLLFESRCLLKKLLVVHLRIHGCLGCFTRLRSWLFLALLLLRQGLRVCHRQYLVWVWQLGSFDGRADLSLRLARALKIESSDGRTLNFVHTGSLSHHELGTTCCVRSFIEQDRNLLLRISLRRNLIKITLYERWEHRSHRVITLLSGIGLGWMEHLATYVKITVLVLLQWERYLLLAW